MPKEGNLLHGSLFSWPAAILHKYDLAIQTRRYEILTKVRRRPIRFLVVLIHFSLTLAYDSKVLSSPAECDMVLCSLSLGRVNASILAVPALFSCVLARAENFRTRNMMKIRCQLP